MAGSTTFRFNSGTAVAKEIDGEVIVINVATGRYYSLEGVAAVAWIELIEGAPPVRVAAAIAEAFDVEPKVAEADMAGFVDELVAEELIVTSDESAPPGLHPSTPATDRRSYAPPTLCRFDDMEDLLAFDPPLPAPHPVDGAWRPR